MSNMMHSVSTARARFAGCRYFSAQNLDKRLHQGEPHPGACGPAGERFIPLYKTPYLSVPDKKSFKKSRCIPFLFAIPMV
jgi:hypothetical protein